MPDCFLKFYVAENRRYRHHLVYEWLLHEAQQFGFQGGSAYRTLAGFGRHGRLHDEHFFELAGDVPVEVGFVVSATEADQFIAHLASHDLNLFYLRIPVTAGFTMESRPL
jgi:uncharacterized protein